MKVRWLGHSCFLVTNEKGGRLVTDPFDPSVGYPLPGVEADVVTVSHEHHDHNYIEGLKEPEKARVLHGLQMGPDELVEAAGFKVRAVATCHDDADGTRRGGNAVFVIEADGARLAHLGDLGHEPTAAQYAQIGPVDGLLIPVGGYFTIDSDTAWRVARRIGARTVVAMHFKTDCMNFPITDAETFARLAGGARRDADQIEIGKDEGVFIPKL